jgi:hypothetical protein
MKFAVEIGEAEKNRLEYHSNQLLGSLTITMNGTPLKRSLRFFNEPILEVDCFVVGDHEKTTIRIEKQRHQLFGYTNRLYINDRLTRVFRGL